MFTKLALVSSLAISANAMAMQSMDDAALSAATGQDGINIGIALGSGGITIDKLYLHDNDGLATSTGITGSSGTAGAIAISGVTVTQKGTGNLLDLAIDTNGASGSNGAFLNVAATVGAVDVHVGSIGVGTSGTLNQTTAVRGITETAPTEIISGLDLSLGQISANVQLGSTPQGAMIKVNSSLQGGLTLSNFGINDAAGGGKIVLDKVMVRGAGNTTGDLDVNADISVVPTGLRIQNNSTQGMNVYAQGVHLGAAGNASIGDLEIQGLNVGKSTITISGH
ncbi:protein FilA [Acinetobacter baumannii]|uniref:Protein FilA n=2 Tax=Acinetobacter baumannii TaxID=470 RepID=A0A9P2P6I1_ACIBA|nr:protein FilA [Acinetobacter baumannii]MDB0302180.1 protein FilA [Acinetobacter baumannii]POZ09044.1 protein FilA [Acinetobacter baumannii]QJF41124.1 protein FilA [Acinetobacter baumannii]RSP93023.1 protein FilA [Acinetobacter baumannii]